MIKHAKPFVQMNWGIPRFHSKNVRATKYTEAATDETTGKPTSPLASCSRLGRGCHCEAAAQSCHNERPPADTGGIGHMRQQIRCWKGWRRKHAKQRKACGLLRFRCRRGSGGSGSQGGVSMGGGMAVKASRGRKGRNIFRKIKENIHKFLSPASVDKPVHKIPLLTNNRAFFDH